jgi:hypothetical protein
MSTSSTNKNVSAYLDLVEFLLALFQLSPPPVNLRSLASDFVQVIHSDASGLVTNEFDKVIVRGRLLFNVIERGRLSPIILLGLNLVIISKE